jgi:hypothetical protein
MHSSYVNVFIYACLHAVTLNISCAMSISQFSVQCVVMFLEYSSFSCFCHAIIDGDNLQ